MPEKTSLADILQKQGKLTDEQISQVKLEEINTGRDQASILKERGWVSPVDITKAKAQLMKVEFVDVSTFAPSPDVLAKVPESVARHYNLIPLKEEDGSLQVAMEDPLDLQLIEFLETKPAKR